MYVSQQKWIKDNDNKFFRNALLVVKLINSVKKVTSIGAGSGVPGGAQAPPELFLAPPEPFEPPLTIKKIMH